MTYGYPPYQNNPCQGCPMSPVRFVEVPEKKQKLWKRKLTFEEAIKQREKLNKFIEDEIKHKKEKDKKPEPPKGFLGLSFQTETALMMIMQGVILYFVMNK